MTHLQKNNGDFFDDIDDVKYDEEISEEITPAPKKKHQKFIYTQISDLGGGFIYYSGLLFTKLFRVIALPFVFLINFIKEAKSESEKISGQVGKSFRQQASDFNEDYKSAKKLLRSRKSDGRKLNPFSMLIKFISLAFKRHKTFLLHSLNYALPVLALVVMLFVIRYYGRLNLALSVTYNDVNIGYIESEKVFNDAKDILEERLTLDNKETDKIVSLPEYKIAVVKLNELSDSSEICDRIIENSDSGLTTACGVYVDGKFIGSVKNESDASGVFKSVKTDYCRKNDIDEKNSDVIVGLVEEISYVQGLYNEDTVLDSTALKNYITKETKSESSSYTAESSDSAESICSKFGITAEQLYALNPNLDAEEGIKSGTKINVIKSIPFINVTISKTETVTQEIDYKTVQIETDALYKGVKQAGAKGQKGEEIITNLITYVNDEVISEKVINRIITKPAVDEQIFVGTKPVPMEYFTFYGVGEGTFIWPAVKAHTVTSGFGYRNLFGATNFHRGVDISGAGVLGTPIIASASGVVEKTTAGNTGYGYSVLIDHGGGIKTRYGHMLAGSIIVNPGDQVVQGQMIGLLGSTGNSTGPHLHFEIMYNGAYTNPLDYVTR